MYKNLYFAAVITPLLGGASFAQDAATYLAPKKAVAVLADGHPWSSTGPDGKPLELTLNKDGTGSIKGPMPFRLSVKWTVKGEAICLAGVMGTKCLRFQEVANGYQGWDGDEPEMRLSR